MNSPATSLVGSGGWPGPTRQTELKRFARKSQLISAASRTVSGALAPPCIELPDPEDKSWSRLSEQNLRVDKWSLCRV